MLLLRIQPIRLKTSKSEEKKLKVFFMIFPSPYEK